MACTQTSGRTAVVLGSTGLVGHFLWPMLVAHPDIWQRILLVVRRPLEDLPPRVEALVADFARIGEQLGPLKADDLFCCLGTTRAKAGSKEAFRRVDHDYVLDAARALKSGGLEQAVVISAVGADPQSPFFYSRVKGEMEQDLEALKLPHTVIMRPSLLLGDRRERRPIEKLAMKGGQALGWMLRGPLESYRPVDAQAVAGTMVTAALQNIRADRKGAAVQIVTSPEMLPPFAKGRSGRPGAIGPEGADARLKP